MKSIVDQYVKLHRDPAVFRGTTCLEYAALIRKLCVETGAKSLLDFGSGKGEQYRPPYEVQKWWGVDAFPYDPGVPDLSVLPGREFDGVICVDVLEHLPEEEVQDTIDYLITAARKFVFLTACPRLANRKLPDGQNAHLTVRPLDWWSGMVKDRRIKLDTTARGLVVEFRLTP